MQATSILLVLSVFMLFRVCCDGGVRFTLNACNRVNHDALCVMCLVIVTVVEVVIVTLVVVHMGRALLPSR
jgi:hypothetical protein